MSDHKYQFEVKMSCSGCSNAVNKALLRKDGVSNVDISLEKQTVNVQSSLPYNEVLETIKKTGKEVIGGSTLA